MGLFHFGKKKKENAAAAQAAEQKAEAVKAEQKQTPNKEVKAAPKTQKEEPAVTVQEPAPEKEAEAPAKPGAVGRFEIKKTAGGKGYVFNLFAPNRVIVATSQTYTTSQAALGGIKSVIAHAEIAPVEDQTLKNYEVLGCPKWEIYKDKGEQFRFRLIASNGNGICHSQGYTSKANCKNGIESIIRNAKFAEIDKAYLKKDE